MNNLNENTVEITVWKSNEPSHPYPWMFYLVVNGVPLHFCGIPNQCETKRSAIARASWRKKWILEGRSPYKEIGKFEGKDRKP